MGAGLLNWVALSPSIYKNFTSMVFWIRSRSVHRVKAANWLKRSMPLSSVCSALASPHGQCQDTAMALEDTPDKAVCTPDTGLCEGPAKFQGNERVRTMLPSHLDSQSG